MHRIRYDNERRTYRIDNTTRRVSFSVRSVFERVEKINRFVKEKKWVLKLFRPPEKITIGSTRFFNVSVSCLHDPVDGRLHFCSQHIMYDACLSKCWNQQRLYVSDEMARPVLKTGTPNRRTPRPPREMPHVHGVEFSRRRTLIVFAATQDPGANTGVGSLSKL